MRAAALPLLVLAVTLMLHVKPSAGTSEAALIHACTQYCIECVLSYGGENYAGLRCIHNCQDNKGRPFDELCNNTDYMTVKDKAHYKKHKVNDVANLIWVCKQYCGLCSETYGNKNYDAGTCMDDCETNNGRPRDEYCNNTEYMTVKDSKNSKKNEAAKANDEDEDSLTRVCQQYCGYCVITWGKENYNGKKCFDDCAANNGDPRDENCENEEYHTVKDKAHSKKHEAAKANDEDQDSPTRVCQLYCGYCVVTWGKDNYNGKKCFDDCAANNGDPRDENCENEEYHTVKDKAHNKKT